METGTLSSVRGVGRGYWKPHTLQPRLQDIFGRDRDAIIILLGGGTKRRQHIDIENARDLWQEYQHRKRQEA